MGLSWAFSRRSSLEHFGIFQIVVAQTLRQKKFHILAKSLG